MRFGLRSLLLFPLLVAAPPATLRAETFQHKYAQSTMESLVELGYLSAADAQQVRERFTVAMSPIAWMQVIANQSPRIMHLGSTPGCVIFLERLRNTMDLPVEVRWVKGFRLPKREVADESSALDTEEPSVVLIGVNESRYAVRLDRPRFRSLVDAADLLNAILADQSVDERFLVIGEAGDEALVLADEKQAAFFEKHPMLQAMATSERPVNVKEYPRTIQGPN